MGKMSRRSKQTPSSSFKKALKKLRSVRSHSKQCKLLRNSSDEFLRDLALFTHKCLPGIQPLISKTATKQIKHFCNPNTSVQSRRRMVEQKGGGFLDFLKNVALTIWHNVIG